MKTLYLDCGMGAAGDMLTAALVELMPDTDQFIAKLNELSIPGVEVKKESAVKCGIRGTHISVMAQGVEESEEMYDHAQNHDHGHRHHHSYKSEQEADHHHEHHEPIQEADHHHEHHEPVQEASRRHENHDHVQEADHSHDHHDHRQEENHDKEHHDHDTHHHHSSMQEIEHIISELKLPSKVQRDILAVYHMIAEAESYVHGVPVTEIHFHEVGTMDAVADITAVCLLMNELAPDEVVVSPVHVGSGHVKCAHGILPVPAPATAYLLKDVPIYGGAVKGELCTPTGAALLKYFATRFGDMPVMKTQAIGYGMGKKDFQMANCVRAMLGEAADKTDAVLELSCNVDDMTAEAVGFAMDRLFEGGALEVYTVPIGMKKSRPGTLIRVMCREQDKEEILGLLFKHTTTIGVRESMTKRYVLDRKLETVQTPYGDVRRKVSSGYGVNRVKYEYDDLSRIAKEQNISLDEVRKLLEN